MLPKNSTLSLWIHPRCWVVRRLWTDVTLLTVRSGQTPMKALAATVETLRRINVPITGIVLNKSAIAGNVAYKAYRRYYTAVGSA